MRRTSLLLTLALVLMLASSLTVTADPGTIDVSQPIQVTNDSHYERGQSIAYDGTNYWLFYGRSAGCTTPYATGSSPDVNDYVVYYKKASTVAGLASATATAISGVAHNSNSYLGETGAAYFGDAVWAFATIDVGTTADLYGWWTAGGGATWNEVGPTISGLSAGQAHHDEVAFGGELWVVEGSGNFTTMHSANPKIGGWSAPLIVDASLTGGLVHFFVEGTDLYLAINASATNYIYKYDSGTPAWDKVDENAPPNPYDPTLFKVGSSYVFAQAPWDGTKQYILQWSGARLDGDFFTATSKMVTEGAYGSNPWVDMWPIGFTDQSGDSYLFVTSERNPNDPSIEIDGNIWYLEVDWDVTRDHYTYIQEAIDAATSTTINVAAGTYAESVTIDKDNLTLLGDSSSRPAITGGLKLDTDLTGLTFENFTVSGAVPGRNSVVRMYGAITDLTIDNCVFDGENTSGRNGFTGGQLEGDVTIRNSEFKNILGWALLDSRSSSGGDGSAMGTVTFADNNVHDCDGSLVFRGLSTDWTDNVYIYGNTFEDIGEAGVSDHWAAFEVNRAINVEIYDNEIRNVVESSGGEGQAMQLWKVGTVAIYDNTIENNYMGIAILKWPEEETYDVSGIAIYGNSFSGNDQFALSVENGLTGGPVDAEKNWWGHPGGPQRRNPDNVWAGPKRADRVSGNVDYHPWLHRE